MAAAGEGRTEQTQQLLDALSSPVRREILWLIWDRELPAGEITRAFTLGAPTISQHLAVLRDAELVSMRRAGTFRYYQARQDALTGVRELLVADGHRWLPSPEPPPPTPSATIAVVAVGTEAPCSRGEAFRAFTDPVLYGRWLGVPVTLRDGAFATTMEWGLEVRGTYDHVVEPSLLVMTWDFDEGAVPLPGAGRRAYLEFFEQGDGCRLELHQMIDELRQARRMERAWGLILSRFRDHIVDALDPTKEIAFRAPVERRGPTQSDHPSENTERKTQRRTLMDPITTLAQAFDEASAVLSKVTAEQWSLPSPCSEWDVRGVAQHMTMGAMMVADCVAGKAFAPPAGDALGDDPAAAFRAAADAALAAFRADPAVLGKPIAMPFGEMPGAVVAGIFTNDEFAHAWDVAKATGQSTDLNPAMAEGCLEVARQFITPHLRSPGMFGDEVAAPSGASAADRLAAFMGRSV